MFRFSFIKIAKEVEPYLSKTNGSLLTYSFIGSTKVIPEYSLMGPAKAALESSMKYIAYEVGDKGIRVNALSVGPISTISARAVPNFNQLKEKYNNLSPLKYENMDENQMKTDLFNLSTFLVSDLSKSITGQVIYVDKGFNLI